MYAPLRITVPDETLAQALQRRLRPFDVETHSRDGRVELEIALRDRNPERDINHVLKTVDGWLDSSGIRSVQVHLDGNAYTLNALGGGVATAERDDGA